jgi:hypothetical protein
MSSVALSRVNTAATFGLRCQRGGHSRDAGRRRSTIVAPSAGQMPVIVTSVPSAVVPEVARPCGFEHRMAGRMRLELQPFGTSGVSYSVRR